MEVDISGVPVPFTIRHDSWARQMLEGMANLRHGLVLCDTTIVTDDGGTFRAHSNLLAACSPVLRSSFPSDGNQEFLVPLHGIPSTSMALLLDFLYTGCIECDGDSLIQVMLFADQLEIPGLSEAISVQQQNQSQAQPSKPGIQLQDAGVQVTHVGSRATLSGPDDTNYEIFSPQPRGEEPSVPDAIPASPLEPLAAEIGLQLVQVAEETGKEQDVPGPDYTTTTSIKQEVASDWDDDADNDMGTTDAEVAKVPSPPTPRRSSRAIKKSQVLTAYEQQRNKRRSVGSAPASTTETQSSTGTKTKRPPAVTEDTKPRTNKGRDEALLVQEYPGMKTRRRGARKAAEAPAVQVKLEPREDILKDGGHSSAEQDGPEMTGGQQAQPQGPTDTEVPVPETQTSSTRKRKKKSTEAKNLDDCEDSSQPMTELNASDGAEPKRKRAYRKHSKSSTGDSSVKKEKTQFPCSICGKTFRYASGRSIHEMRHQQIKPWKCDFCDKAFITKSALQIHRRTHTGEKPFVCQYCGTKFGDPSAWRQHERKHTDASLWPCTLCSSKFETKRQLVKHQKSKHGTVDKPLKCSICFKGFIKEFELRIHERIHRLGLVCNVCGKVFARRSGLEIHQRLHTGEKPFKCSHCGLTYASEVSLKCHERKHVEGCQFQCQYCTRKFFRQWECDIHERTHTGERPYACQHCPATFKGISHLRVHERSHTGTKPYECKKCPSKFTNSSALRRHEITHTDERPYTCDECGRMFRRPTHLRSHKRTHGIVDQMSLEDARTHVQKTTAADRVEGVDSEDIAGIVSIVQGEEEVAEDIIEVSTVPGVASVQEVQGVSVGDLGEITVEEMPDSDAPIYIQILNMV